MGNSQSLCKQSSKSKSKSKLAKKTRQKNKNETSRIDDFMIEYHQTNKIRNKMVKEARLDNRRVIFVSLISAYQTWRQCPSHVLYSAIFLVPLKRKWFYEPETYAHEIQHSLLCSLNVFTDIAEADLFIKMLKWKDEQGLVFWMLEDYKHLTKSNPETSIHPFWQHFNEKLTNLYDPITGTKYNPLNLDDSNWQKNKSPGKYKYCNKITSILSELYFMRMNYKSIQEILFQSNPKSLIPIKAYNMQCNIYSNKRCELFQEFEENDNMQDWFISEDYDPFELDQSLIN